MSRKSKQQLFAFVAADPDAMMDSLLVRAFFGGKGKTTFNRWRTHPDPERRFPEPDMYIGNAPYWTRRTVIAHRDRQAKFRDVRGLAAQASAARAQQARLCNPPTHSATQESAAPVRQLESAASETSIGGRVGQPNSQFGG
jgi:hypothetical protein